MAEKVKLRDYQKSILDRLDLVRTDSSSVVNSYLGVQIGGKNVLVNLLDISETLVVSDIYPVPLVKSWFLGMSNVRGVLYAINDVGQLLVGQATGISSDTRMLLINNSIASNIGILAEKLIGLRQLEMFKPKEGTFEDSVCFKPNVLSDDNNNDWYMLDCEKLINSKEFQTPYAT